MVGRPVTPMMQQYREAKARHPDAILFFRNGDFYELFEDDAFIGHKVLGLTLTKRDKEIPMAGVPVPQLERYMGMLLKAGYRVAVCEQMEEADPKKKLIPREVTQVVTPGTITDEGLLDPRTPNHLAAVVAEGPGTACRYGLAWVELTTGTFHACDVAAERLPDELGRIGAAELLFPESLAEVVSQWPASVVPVSRTPRPDWQFAPETARAVLHEHFRVSTLAGFGFADDQPCIRAAGALLHYLRETLKGQVRQLGRLQLYRPEERLILDEVTRRSLELTRTLRDNQRAGSLLAAIDRTVTPMGARLLHDQLLAPPVRKQEIEQRLDAVEELWQQHALRQQLRQLLTRCADLQRLTARLATQRATPRDLAAVLRTLRLLPQIKQLLQECRASLLVHENGRLDPCAELCDRLEAALADEPPLSPKDGGVFRQGYSPELDELRQLAREGKNWIARYQAQEIARTGISSLKVGYNQVFGYYIEITHANAARVPPDYIRKGTLKNAERYITPALKEYEEKIVSAEERARALEIQLFAALREEAAAHTPRLLAAAEALAMLDFLAGLAELAAERGYVRPVIVTEAILDVREGRHPVLEQTLPPGTFVPNDVRCDGDGGIFWLITGPNMSGKSTFIRQVALLTLLAHLGSFLPARSARIGITDRIFTRVGASDELSRGLSTFMVEMTEAANILNNATPRSLVILDEIGRGTSTYDGISLAWAITEYLHDVIGCRTLFATHYHELAQLAHSLPNLRNYNVLVRETDRDVVFLHRIAPGYADKSYGIHVARLAGLPEEVLQRAAEVLRTLESRHELPAPLRRTTQLVEPPEGPPRRKHKLRPLAPAGPSLFGDDKPSTESGTHTTAVPSPELS
ncbi:MAG: DNA mismatch repair protein MutS [Gemmataceae bacterium]|nr:DNA mismatch repair protein MutS [Gemmataceae bacterium]